MKKVYTLNRVIVGINSQMILTPLQHFAHEADVKQAKAEADEAYTELGKCVLFAQTPSGPKMVMPVMTLLQDMRIGSIGHGFTTGDYHESLILGGAPPNMFRQ